MKKYLFIIISFFLGFCLGLVVDSLPKWFNFSDALCLDGTQPDKNGCCEGELYTDMGYNIKRGRNKKNIFRS